jgi:LPXTG-motif cell wall-anchored protein
MTVNESIALAIGAALVAAGAMLVFRRRREGSSRGSQGGVILLLIGAMAVVYGLGLTKYRPSPFELEAMGQ